MNNLDRIEIFMKWYSTQGHWIYPTRAAALSTWTTRGIDNLPDAPKDLSIIQEWVTA